MNNDRRATAAILAAAAILMVTQGVRLSMGLFVSPLNTSTGLGIATVSFAFAVGQIGWGAVQPFAGAIADRHGPAGVLVGGMLLLALGLAITPFMGSGPGLVLSLGVLAAVGSGAGSFSVLIGTAVQGVPAQRRARASAVVNAGGSLGQFVFAPLAEKLIQLFAWTGALTALAGISLAAVALVRPLARGQPARRAPPAGSTGAWSAVRASMGDGSYLLLHAGFFTCGFHTAFLVTHLPGEVSLCGLPASVASWSLAIIGLANTAGILALGLFTSRYRTKYVLAAMYASRAVLVAAYLVSPRTSLTFYLFAFGLGLTWLATVPATATLVGKLFEGRYLATLFGLTLLSHQVGSFLGAWLGGVALSRMGSFQWIWYTDIALAAMAALVNLPIREARMPAAGAIAA
jgi:predicted MFS family arabinose efflux permease